MEATEGWLIYFRSPIAVCNGQIYAHFVGQPTLLLSLAVFPKTIVCWASMALAQRKDKQKPNFRRNSPPPIHTHTHIPTYTYTTNVTISEGIGLAQYGTWTWFIIHLVGWSRFLTYLLISNVYHTKIRTNTCMDMFIVDFCIGAYC